VQKTYNAYQVVYVAALPNNSVEAIDIRNSKIIHSFEKLATIALGSDADDVRYNSAGRKIYVGYGAGGIAIINADSHQQIANMDISAYSSRKALLYTRKL
jgi:DNA-binding beta-propeller fold protein YncE